MSWIKTINPDEASGKLKEIYNRVSTPNKRVDNILMAHSLRPHTLVGHMQFYLVFLTVPCASGMILM